MENGKLTALISLVVGMVLGMNWPKIKKFIPKAKGKVVEMAETAKESVEDVTKKVLHQTPKAKGKVSKAKAAAGA